ncbi:MAG: hypothetical protein H6610_02855 [Ignavibacteriales bacterium]|nr:hypothetical protein [Ignavibacteriales bacterium]MCB9218385.1 hypothetical protein [Ignavibacteriales bacterium]MCB9260681.1 hypothetical protein [Ignavibacteriales bacterium]
MNNLLKNFLLLFSTIFILLILSEFSLRFFLEPLNSGWGWEDSPRRKLATFDNDRPNQLNLRGQQIKYDEDDFVILILGDSQVESATSPPNEMPEILLENYLNDFSKKHVKVFSVAASAWGQDQQLIALEKYYSQFRADLVLIWFTPKNDFWENTFPDRNVGVKAGHLKPTFLLNQNKLEGPFLNPNEYYKNSALLHLIYKAIQSYNDSNLEELILAEWYEKIPIAHSIDETPENKINSTFQIDLDKYSKEIFALADSNNITIITYEDFINSRGHFAPYLENKSPRDLYQLEITKKLIEKIDSCSISNNSKMIVFYPLREDFDSVTPNSVRNVKSYRIKDKYFPVNLNYLETIKRTIPQKKLFTFSIEGQDEICVDHSDRHLNLLGNTKVAEELGNYLLLLLNNKEII